MEDNDLDKSCHGFPVQQQDELPTAGHISDALCLEEVTFMDEYHRNNDIDKFPSSRYHSSVIIDAEDENNRAGFRRKYNLSVLVNHDEEHGEVENDIVGVDEGESLLSICYDGKLKGSISSPGATAFNPSCNCPSNVIAPIMREIVAGMVVALATIPTSISYAAVIGISPSTGIWNSAILGFCTSVVGGAPGMITGAAGAAALPMSRIYKVHGLSWMTTAVLLASFIELVFGFSKLSRLGDIVTEPVIIGFFNALSIFILKSQAIVFQDHQGRWFHQTMLVSSAFTALLCTSIILCLRPWKQRLIIPLPLLGILISSIIVPLLQIPVLSLEHFTGGHQFDGGWQSLPSLVPFPDIPWTSETLLTILPAALGMSVVSIMETIVTQKVVSETIYRETIKAKNIQDRKLRSNDRADSDHNGENSSDSDYDDSGTDEEDDTVKRFMKENNNKSAPGSFSPIYFERDKDSMFLTQNHYDANKVDSRRIFIVQDNNQAMIGQGIGNFIAAMFGGFGGCPLLPKTILNVVTGGRGWISTSSYAVSLMAMILFCGPLLGCIPMAALSGVMFSIAYETFKWKESMELMEQSPKSLQAMLNTLAMLLTSYLSFTIDMGLGVMVGVVVSKLPAIFVWLVDHVTSVSYQQHSKIAAS